MLNDQQFLNQIAEDNKNREREIERAEEAALQNKLVLQRAIHSAPNSDDNLLEGVASLIDQRILELEEELQ